MAQGLTTTEALLREHTYGPNDVSMRTSSFARKFLLPLISPISLMLLAAAFMSRLDGKLFDFYFILVLYAVNYAIQKWQEFKADKALSELQKKLDFTVSVCRDNTWTAHNAKTLVPGDYIRLGLGSIIPADATVAVARNLSVNEAVLTGESLPKEKAVGDTIYSGSFITAGYVEATITATGKHTTFGKTVFSIEQPSGKSILEKDILRISRFLTILSLIAVVILSTILFLQHAPWKDTITLDLSLVIAGIPIALPAVMAVILSIGAGVLAKKSVIVRRLSALQDLSNVTLLLTDKTGTLTNNEIKIVRTTTYEGTSAADVLSYARYAVEDTTPNAIDQAIISAYQESGQISKLYAISNFIPYDSDRKRTTASIAEGADTVLISVGAPQVIESFATFKGEQQEAQYRNDIDHAADEGFRVIAVAIKRGDITESNMTIIGLLYLSDPLDASASSTIRFMQEHGINVRMLTGDNIDISKRITKELGLTGSVIAAQQAHALLTGTNAQALENVATFAEVLPKDKYDIINAFKQDHIIAVTGDGINDLPALRAAHVGIAVSGAVSALKSMADIVLMNRGLSVISDAVLESRKIFVRLYNYSVYRISESFRLIITILILGVTYGFYPLVPLQLILLALLNDIPIISLAVDRVRLSPRPAAINAKKRLTLSVLFGLVGVVNSMVFFLLMRQMLHLPLGMVQTMFFLKLTVSGHALIFVAHTKKRWFTFLPSKAVVIAVLSTQAVATTLAVTGFLMPSPITPAMAAFVWVWSLIWMQVSEFMKDMQHAIMPSK